jgi:hypothetical protein
MTDVVLYTYVAKMVSLGIPLKRPARNPRVLADQDTHSLGNKGSVLTMGSVPVATIEYADCLVTFGRKRLEEADEASFVVELMDTS